MNVKVKDENNIPKLLNIIETIRNKKILVGIFKGEMLLIAAVNEYGAKIKVTKKMRAYLHQAGLHLRKNTTNITVPERSFIRKGYDVNLQKFVNYINKQILLLFNFKISIEQFYQRIGSFCVSKIKEFLTNLRTPPNHPFTISVKKSSNPLINTGNLRKSIIWRIE